MMKHGKKPKGEDVSAKWEKYSKKFTVEKIMEMASRLESPEYQEERLKDITAVIRSVKHPETITRGARFEGDLGEETAMGMSRGSSGSRRKSAIEHTIESLKSPDIQLPPAMAANVGFLETMASPRPPVFDETESETSIERLSMDSDTDLSPSLLELVKTDEEAVEDEADKKSSEKGLSRGKKVTLSKVTVPVVQNEKNKSQEKTQKPKRKSKKWKPKVKKSPMKLDPMFTELTEEVCKYLNEVGIFGFMRAWVEHLYALNPRPKNPVMELRMLLQKSLGVSQEEIDISVLEKELNKNLRKEDEIRVETSKLLHLCHLLAPEIYDAKGDFILQEPSIEEEPSGLVEEEGESQVELENLFVPSRTKRASKHRMKKNKGKKDDELRSVGSKISTRSKRDKTPKKVNKMKATPSKVKTGK